MSDGLPEFADHDKSFIEAVQKRLDAAAPVGDAQVEYHIGRACGALYAGAKRESPEEDIQPGVLARHYLEILLVRNCLLSSGEELAKATSRAIAILDDGDLYGPEADPTP